MSDSEPHFSTNSPDSPAGRLVVISGPSGVGKSTVVDGLRDVWPFEFSVSATTRPPRADEVAGEDYHFVNRDVFEAMIDSQQFLEWAEYAEHLYGTPRRPIVEALEAGQNILLDIEVKGAVQVMEAYPEVCTIFLMPPSMEVLERRLRGRNDTDQSAIEGRLAVAEMQMAVGRERFQHRLINEDVSATIRAIRRILSSDQSPV